MDEAIFKAYDIRGIYPDQLNEDTAYKIGQGYAKVIKPQKAVAVSRDVRLHSKDLQQAAIQGLLDAGIDVVDIGLVSTEMNYFAVGHYDFGGGIQATASHNPAEWHGFKMVRENVIPLTGDNELKEIKAFVLSGEKITAEKKGQLTTKDILDDYCHYLLTWVKADKLKKIKLVYDPNFGFEGKILERLVQIAPLDVDLIPLNAEPDGTFPKGRPDPYLPETRGEFVDLVRESKADLGVTWDADADRVFFCADGGLFVEPYFMNAFLIKEILKGKSGEKVVYDPRTTWATIDSVKEAGGELLLERVGHVYIKRRMRQDNAIFSGESSGHTYFRDFWYADNGMIPLLLVWELLSSQPKPLSELIRPVIDKYLISGEINFKTEHKDAIMAEIEHKYADSELSKVDGLSVEYPDWRANIRASNTESLLRLNLEAKTPEILEAQKKELTGIIESHS